MLGAIAESVVGAPTVRAYGVRARTAARIDAAIDRHYRASVDAQKVTAAVFVTGEFVAALANAAVVVVGVLLGLAGDISRRHADRLPLPRHAVRRAGADGQRGAQRGAERASPGSAACSTSSTPSPTSATRRSTTRSGVHELPAGPLGVRFDRVTFRYAPGARPALDGVDLTIEPRRRVAIVGRDRLGQDDVRQAGHPAHGPGRGARAPRLRRRRLGAARRGRLRLAARAGGDGAAGRVPLRRDRRRQRPLRAAGHDRRRRSPSPSRSWASAPGSTGCADGVATPVGQRGESLSAGERQLVAVARAYVADPDLLVLDEATSAVDPATEQRLTRALDTLTDGRTTLTIAHRLSTAERADEILVVDAGHVVQRGTHADLVDADGPYARLHASWRRSSAGEPRRPPA